MAAAITVRESLLSRTRRLDPETLVLRVPPGMTSQSAIVTRTEEGQAIIYWAGCQQRATDGRRILGCGVLGCFVSLGAAVALGDERVLVRDKMGEPTQDVWVIGEIQ